jgi:hypothetical protein
MKLQGQVSAMLLEQNDEWTVQRARYMTLETIAPLSDDPTVALRLSPADRPGSCRRTRCPTASYTTPGDTIPGQGYQATAIYDTDDILLYRFRLTKQAHHQFLLR